MLRAKLFKLWPIILLVLLFGVSLLLRIGSFSIDPVKDQAFTQFGRFNNTEIWLHDKYVLDVYDTYPVSTHMFAPYVGGDDEFLPREGVANLYVYTSFPSSHFVALYGVLKAFGSEASYLGLQLFSLTIHLACVLLLYYLIFLLTRNKFMSVLGAAIYIFSTGTLWYHMNVYWAHQLLMPVFLTALIVFVRQKGIFRWWQGLILGFLMSIITWTGAIAVVGFASYGAYKFWRTRKREYLSYLFMVGGMVLALIGIVLQILLITGASIPEYIDRVVHRAQARSTGATTMTLPFMIWNFCSNLVLDYGGYMLIAYTLAIRHKLQGFQWDVLFVASFPLLETLVILEHDAVYGFGRLKWLIPVILLITMLGSRVINTKKRKIIFAVIIALASILHSLLYLVIFDKPAA
jgi:hypothetical protein